MIGINKPSKDAGTVEGWRSIALAEAAYKGVAKAFREKLLPAFTAIAGEAQCGAKRGCPIEYPSHIVRAYVQAANKKCVSGGVLFLDGRDAYYSALREHLFDGKDLENPEGLRALLTALHPDQQQQDELFSMLMGPGLLSRTDTPSGVCGFLKAAMSASWFSLRPESGLCYRTATGTVPGTPIADLLFQEIQIIFLPGLQQRLQELNLEVKTYSREVAGPMPCWADDLAVLLPFCKACEVVDNLKTVVRTADHWSRNTGIHLNYNAGKSEAVLVFKGEGCEAEKSRYLTAAEPHVSIELTSGKHVSLRLVQGYDHLGGRVCHHGNSLEDLQKRAGLAEAVFTRLKKTLLRNPELMACEKVGLVLSLVLRKFLFGSGMWILETAKDRRAFSARVMSFYRRSVWPIFGVSSQGLTDQEVCALLEVLTPEQVRCLELVRQLRVVVANGSDFLLETVCDAEVWLSSALTALQDMLAQLKLHWGLPTSWKAKLLELKSRVEQLRLLPGRYKREVLRARQGSQQQALSKAARLRDFVKVGGMVFKVPAVRAAGTSWCSLCAAAFKSTAAKASHDAKRHGVRAPSAAAAFGTRCEKCALEYWCTDKLRQHLARSPLCLAVYANSDITECGKLKVRPASAWRPVVRTEGPRPFWATLNPKPPAEVVVDADADSQEVAAAMTLCELAESCHSAVTICAWFQRVLAWMAHHHCQYEGIVSRRPHRWHQLLDLAHALQLADFQVPKGSLCSVDFRAWASEGYIFVQYLQSAVA